jgi:predicted transposase/invertase (TIGR01784 family)
MASIDKIHSNFFTRVFSNVENVVTFLKVALPEELQRQLDLSEIALDPTTFVSEEYKPSFSDLVVKCRTKAENLPVDIYFLFEHKSYQDEGIFLQLLKYMYLMWQKDSGEKKPPRIIIPLVFYHGKDPWQMPTHFVEQFHATGELKQHLLNFSYILFDTNSWNWEAESSRPLKENIFLLSAMLLMKAAFQKDLELIRQVFKLWHQIGFVLEKELIIFLLIYAAETQEISLTQLEKMMDESKLKGEEVMPTLAQRLREEGAQQGYLLDKQEVLIMQLATRFFLSEDEKQLIREVKEMDKLNAALRLVVTAQTKEEILNTL